VSQKGKGGLMRRAFTIIELLVSISVIGILVALTLVALSAARESTRRTQCRSQLRQLALATLAHVDTQKHFPTAGWGGIWVGLPGRGFGIRQPGGWAYNVLPFLEEKQLHALGSRMSEADMFAASAARLQTPVPVFVCPSRRAAVPLPMAEFLSTLIKGSLPITAAARSDFAMIAGDQPRCEIGGVKRRDYHGPRSLSAGDDPRFQWPSTHDYTGVSFLRSTVRPAAIRDGASKMYLLGEKYVSVKNYETGNDHGDDWSLYTGFQDDMYRSTNVKFPPSPDGETTRWEEEGRVGSAHLSVWHAAMCDGSVQAISFDIDPEIHRRLGNRADGLPVSEF
jgi:prepilin-type N-terminal cleavage/methylation domain-containing protein